MFAAAEINKYVQSETRDDREDAKDQDDNSTPRGIVTNR